MSAFSVSVPDYMIDDPARCAARRRALAEAIGASPDEDRCGSLYGYQLHHKHGEKPCDACRDARRRYAARTRSARKAAVQ
jgi:hypothetical protein